MHRSNLLELIVFEQRGALRFEFKEILYFCEGLSGELDILLGKLTSSIVRDDRSISVGFRLDLQDGGFGSQFNVIRSRLSLIDGPECLIQDYFLLGNLSFNDCSFVDIWQIYLH